MDKNFIEDVVPPAQKRSIRNIPIPKGRGSGRTGGSSARTSSTERSSGPKPVKRESASIKPPTPPKDSPRFQKPDFYKPRGRKWVWIGGGAVVLVLLLTFLSIFSGAEVVITPKEAEANLDLSLTAINLENRENVLDLGFRVVEERQELRKEVKATGEEEVNEKASGTIIVYNDYSAESQKLIKSTRFETSGGLIYRIDESVTVPGKSADTPGSIEVEVFADEAGDEYNVDLADFTIPGFEGQPQFDSFFAKSKTPMSGGFNGIKRVIQEEDLNAALNELSGELQKNLLNTVGEELSEDFLVLTDGRLFSTRTVAEEPIGDNKVGLVVEGTLKTVVFNLKELSNHLAQNSLSSFNISDEVLVESSDSLNYILDDELVDLSSLNLKVEGQTKFIWQTDEETLKADLVGNSRKDLNIILRQYPSINKAEAITRPFWKTKFPDDDSKIKISVESS